jgi:hypothetical protein
MASAEWEIQGPELVSCNRDRGCPGQFSARPTHGRGPDGPGRMANPARLTGGQAHFAILHLTGKGPGR